MKKKHQQQQHINEIHESMQIIQYIISHFQQIVQNERIGLRVSVWVNGIEWLVLNSRNQFNGTLRLTQINISINNSENGAKLQIFFVALQF